MKEMKVWQLTEGSARLHSHHEINVSWRNCAIALLPHILQGSPKQSGTFVSVGMFWPRHNGGVNSNLEMPLICLNYMAKM